MGDSKQHDTQGAAKNDAERGTGIADEDKGYGDGELDAATLARANAREDRERSHPHAGDSGVGRQTESGSEFERPSGEGNYQKTGDRNVGINDDGGPGQE